MTDVNTAGEGTRGPTARPGGWRRFTVIKTVRESSIITSLYLKPGDEAGWLPFQPGHCCLRPQGAIQLTVILDMPPYDAKKLVLYPCPAGDEPAKLAAMRTIKHALDPTGIMNPGSVLPG
jgi:FAD linked oxidases, C-terminal domain